MNMKKDEYQRMTTNAEKAKIIADLICEWRKEHQGRFIRFYNGIPYELNEKMLKKVVQKLLLRRPGEINSETTPNPARRPNNGAYPVTDFSSSQSPLQEYLELPYETDENDNKFKEASPSQPRKHCLTLEKLLKEVEKSRFLSDHGDLVKGVVKSRAGLEVGKRKAAPDFADDAMHMARKLKAPRFLSDHGDIVKGVVKSRAEEEGKQKTAHDCADDAKPKARKRKAPPPVESPAAAVAGPIPAPLTVHPMSPDQYSATWPPVHATAYGNVTSPPRPPTFFTSALAAAAIITPPNDSQEDANEDEIDCSQLLVLLPDNDDDDDEKS
jgi:hypothetical protein